MADRDPIEVERRTVIERERVSDGGAGWAIAIIILLIVAAVGLYLWYRNRSVAPYTPNTGSTQNEYPDTSDGSNTNINVTVPSGATTSGNVQYQ